MAIAGGAKTNSISVAKPAIKPPVGPKARVGVGERAAGVGDRGRQLGETKIKAQYMAATASATMRNPSVPAWDQP
ncbi:Uncharacterised protein [Raoultella terrigena]|uniref:Uncharacterized protein n=1 Tax=Raoultella terrigena TaxID=577 RepID=A0A4U9D6X1_RAOTE|nr:Uncharacterised protein [Raoultella terrigena]